MPSVRPELMNSYSAPEDGDPLFGTEVTVVASCRLLVTERLTRKPAVSISDLVAHFTLICVALVPGIASKNSQAYRGLSGRCKPS